MGENKSSIKYHQDIPQWKWTMNLLKHFCQNVFISVSRDQYNDEESAIPKSLEIIDNYTSIGPIGGIASAMQIHPNVTWLISTIDQPAMNKKTLSHLITSLVEDAPGICYFEHINSKTFTQPFPCILTSACAKQVFDAVEGGTYSLQEIFNSLKIQKVKIKNPQEIRNLNTQKEKNSFWTRQQKNHPD